MNPELSARNRLWLLWRIALRLRQERRVWLRWTDEDGWFLL